MAEHAELGDVTAEEERDRAKAELSATNLFLARTIADRTDELQRVRREVERTLLENEAKNTALIECVQVAAEKAKWNIRDEFKRASSRKDGGGERAEIPLTPRAPGAVARPAAQQRTSYDRGGITPPEPPRAPPPAPPLPPPPQAPAPKAIALLPPARPPIWPRAAAPRSAGTAPSSTRCSPSTPPS